MADLERDLVLEIFRVGEGSVVKDGEVGERGADEVEDEAKEPTTTLDINIFYASQSMMERHLPYQVIRYSDTSCRQKLSRDHSLMYAYGEGA